MSVPAATPSIFQPKAKTNNNEAKILIMFCTMAISIGIFVFCIPMNHPVSPYKPSIAGAPQIAMRK